MFRDFFYLVVAARASSLFRQGKRYKYETCQCVLLVEHYEFFLQNRSQHPRCVRIAIELRLNYCGMYQWFAIRKGAQSAPLCKKWEKCIESSIAYKYLRASRRKDEVECLSKEVHE